MAYRLQIFCVICAAMAKDDLHFRLRIPDDLKAKVQTAALANHRSITAEIISRLDASFGETASLADISMKLDKLLKLAEPRDDSEG